MSAPKPPVPPESPETCQIRPARPDEAAAARALLGGTDHGGTMLVAYDGQDLLAVCACRLDAAGGCDAQLGVSPQVREGDAWRPLVHRSVGKALAAGVHRWRVCDDAQLGGLWQSAAWSDRPDFAGAHTVFRVMGRR